jgi:phosphoesterase RecJ-like protein
MFKQNDLTAANDLIQSSKNIVITSHKSPDGDSIGSSLALQHFLSNRGIKSTICHPDKMPKFINWLEGSDEIKTLEQHPDIIKQSLENADLIFCLDYNHPSRIGRMGDLLTASDAKKIMIDHHQDPDTGFVDILFSDPKNSSTCQMIYEFIEQLGQTEYIDEKVGTPMYCGIMTDTGSFRFPSTTAKTHNIISDLINKGVNNSSVHERTFDTNSISKLKLNGYAIANNLVLIENDTVAYIHLSNKELTDLNYTKGDTEGLVNRALGITGIKLAVFFKEDEGYVKISFRSKGDNYVNVLANENFSGGGHIYAAGGKFDGKLEDAIKKFVTVIPKYVN